MIEFVPAFATLACFFVEVGRPRPCTAFTCAACLKPCPPPPPIASLLFFFFKVAHLTAVTEYMVVLEGNSRPQNQAIAQSVQDAMEEVHNRVPKKQVYYEYKTPSPTVCYRLAGVNFFGCCLELRTHPYPAPPYKALIY